MRLPYVKEPCSDCPFRKDSLKGWLGKKTSTEVYNARFFVCHKNTKLQCAGHIILKDGENDFFQLAQRMSFDIKLKNKDIIFNNDKDFIEHHT